jgi:flagellar motility protein MotE (MotC chaperone)
MKKLMILGVVALVLFGASAGVSWYLHHLKDTSLAKEDERVPYPAYPDLPGLKSGSATPSTAGPSPRAESTPGSPLSAAVRPTYNPEAEGAVQLAASLRDRLEAVHAREQQLVTRQKNLELIFQDLRTEMTALDEKRKHVGELMKAVETKMAALEQRATDLERKKQDTVKQNTDLRKTMVEIEGVERDRLKQVATMYDSMEPASAAKILQTLVDTGNLETAVKILATMRERQAAKVLAELPDPGAAAQILEKLKLLKKPTPTPPK